MRRTFLQVLPRRLVQYRELRGLTQVGLALAARVPRSTLAIVEAGQAQDMRVSTLFKLSIALGVSADALLGLDRQPLVRSPILTRGLLGGLNPGRDSGLRTWNTTQTCQTCGQIIAPRLLHLPGECMMVLSLAGASAAHIGILFGLSEAAIDTVLRENYSRLDQSREPAR